MRFAATAGLAFLLEEEPLRVAVLSHLANRTGLDVAGVTQFVPEAVQEDLGRPDLEGRDDAGFPLLKIEAKFAAALDRNQLLAFMDDQKRRLGEHGSGAFVVLMPSHRKPEAQALLDSVGAPAAQASPKVATYVMTWDELFEVLDEAAASTASASSDAIASDLLQLRDLCQTLQGLDIRPLGEAASGRDWEQRRTDLERIVERVTEQLSRGDKLLPTGKDSLYTYRRYINTGADVSVQGVSAWRRRFLL